MNTLVDISSIQHLSIPEDRIVSEQNILEQNILEQNKKEHLQNIHNERIKRIHTEAVNMVCRQTDYDENTARDKLEKADYNYEIVLNEFYGISTTKNCASNMSMNQQIYGEIRSLMDTGARNFRIEQENAEKYKKMMSQVD